ncbi:MAG: carboxypeptidase-like regulatory domain-containing protein [Bacteroidia bacterium]|nr:carboxypeptidase-like regulatory domain-containing protein [Bacteroidia bacterium]
MKSVATYCFAILVFVSCKKAPAGSQGPTGPQGPDGNLVSAPNGVITGSVTQFDEYGVIISTGLNTVTVSIKGTTISTITDTKGTYTLNSVPAGIYVLEFRGQKTQTYKNTQVSFPGNGIMYLEEKIYNKPTWTFSNAYVRDTTVSGTHYIRVSASLPPASGTTIRTLLVLFSKNNSIDNTDPNSYDFLVTNSNVAFYIAYNHLNPSDNTYNSPGYSSGTLYYAKVYAITSLSAYYIDAATNQQVYYSVSDQAPVSFTLTMP